MWTIEVYGKVIVWERSFAQYMVRWFKSSGVNCYVYVAN